MRMGVEDQGRGLSDSTRGVDSNPVYSLSTEEFHVQ